MKEDCLFMIFGFTGDLSIKKIIPALYQLFVDGDLKNSQIVGIARRNVKIEKLLDDAKKYIKEVNEKEFKHFVRHFHYFPLNFDDVAGYNHLRDFIESLEKKHSLINRISYLSTSPEFFDVVVKNMKDSNICKGSGFNRIVFEKPFGNDVMSAKKINKEIRKVFKEDQVFRIDHYLGKDIVQDISTLRFNNQIFRALWNKKNIEHIQIILSEDFGIENRGGFYDNFGVLKDVVQNHVVQLLALTLMDPPKKLEGDFIRNEKIRILRHIKIEDVVLGQYKGYRNEKHVKRGSNTETFAALKVFINLRKWKGVPIYILTGKKLKNKVTGIFVQFKKSACLMLDEVCNFGSNSLKLQIQPNEGFYLKLNARDPFNNHVVPVDMKFCHKCKFGPNTPDAYKSLIKEVIKGNQLLFIRSDEVNEEWKIIERIHEKDLKVHTYIPRTIPKPAEDLAKRNGFSWELSIDE